MSSPVEEWIPTINQASSIPDLMNYLKYAFCEYEFNEVQEILLEREKKMKMEIEILTRDHDVIKEEARLLERTQGLAEFQKLQLEEKLQKCRRKCEKLKETSQRLNEEQRVLSDRAKRAEERSEGNSKILKKKNELICELNEKIDELDRKNVESEHLVGVYQDKVKKLDRLVESYEQAELYESGLQLRVMKVEAALAKILKVKVEDLGNLADIIDNIPDVEGVSRPDIPKDGNDIVANGNTNADGEYMAVLSPGVRSTCNFAGSGGIGLPSKDCRSLVLSSAKEEGIYMVRTSPGTQSGQSHRVDSDVAAQDDEVGETLVSGPLSAAAALPIREKPPSEGIIVICDSDSDDDDRNPGNATCSIANHMNKRNKGDSPVNLITKRKRLDSPVDNKENQVVESSHDVDSGDESYSDSYIENLVATLRSKCRRI